MSTYFAKDSTTAQQATSLTKMLTLVVMRQWVPDVDLDDTITVTAADILGGSTANLLNGDVVTYRKMTYGMLLPSGNDAAHCVARNVGALIIAGGGGGSDPYDRFVLEMNTQSAIFGMSTAAFTTSEGTGAGDLMSCNDAAILMAVMNADTFLQPISDQLNYTMVITGANARSYGITNLFNPGTTFPEADGSKYGVTGAGGYCLALLWSTPSAGQRITVVMGEATEAALYVTVRRLMNYEWARSA